MNNSACGYIAHLSFLLVLQLKGRFHHCWLLGVRPTGAAGTYFPFKQLRKIEKVNWNKYCSSDRYNLKALSGGKAKRATPKSRPVRHAKLRQTFFSGRRFARFWRERTRRFARVNAETFGDRRGSFGAFSSNVLEEKKKKIGVAAGFRCGR